MTDVKMPTFVKLIKICMSQLDGFNIKTIEHKLIPNPRIDNGHHLMNLAFKQHFANTLNSDSTLKMLEELIEKEKFTSEEVKFLSGYPALRPAIDQHFDFRSSGQRRPITLRFYVRRFGSLEFLEQTERTRYFFQRYRWYILYDLGSFNGRPERYYIHHHVSRRPMSVQEYVDAMEQTDRNAREIAITGRRPPQKPSKKLNKKPPPVTYQKNNSKSYYNYANTKKHKNGRF